MYVNPVMAQMPNAITRRGGVMFFVDGAGSRGASGLGMSSSVYAIMCHWIVSANLEANKHKNMTLGLIVNGHSTLEGPLANYYLRGDGAVGIVAFGRANHGGVGSWKGISGNQFHVGVEAEGPPFREEQLQAYAVLLAAWYDCTGRHPKDWGISHQMYAPTRKVDVGEYINDIRRRAIHLVDNKIFAGDDPATVPVPEPENLPEVDMFLVFQGRYGMFWAIPSDLSHKSRVHPDSLEQVKAGWNAMGIKWYGPTSFEETQLDLIPDVSAAPVVTVTGWVNADVVGDEKGSV